MMMPTTRAYTYRGRVAHLLPPDASANNGDAALCGRAAWACSPWFGTGSQREYEKAASLPTCILCDLALRWESP